MKHGTVLRCPARYLLNGMVLFAVAFVTGACSHRDVYDAVQHNQQLDCQRYPDARYEECMARVSKSYDEYDQELEALDEGKPPE